MVCACAIEANKYAN